MIKQGVREIFDNISLSVISFLENHIGITDVEFIERQGMLVYAVITVTNNTICMGYRSGRGDHYQVGGGECSVQAP